ncbi:MAG: hypothetical protein AAF755_10400 [Pseudomonadota bacterium]
MRSPYIVWKRGEDKYGALQTDHPGVDQNTPFRVVAVKVRSASSAAPDASPPIAFTPPFTFVPATGNDLARWHIHLTRAESLTQPLGSYMIDAAIEVAGYTIITEPVFVELEGSGVRGV